MEGRRHLPLRPHPAARERLLDRHPAADRQRQPARRARLLLHPHRPDRPLPADARQVRLLPDGLGRQRPARPSAGCRTTTASAATRACPTTRTSRRRRSRTPRSRSRSAGRTSSSCASGWSSRTSRSSSSSGAPSASRSTGSQHYTTIGPKSQTVSQRAFLRNFARGEAYLQEAPTLWDVTFQTAVAQAELEAREYAGAYHRVAFHRPDGSRVHIETTRPELIPSVVALIAHPDDERYQPLFGTTVTSPVFGVEIPVLAHPAAEMDKGAGIAMCCTFGDLTDVTWWRELRPAGAHPDRPRRPDVAARPPSGCPTSPRPRRTRTSRARPRSPPARRSSPSSARAATWRASRPRPSG